MIDTHKEILFLVNKRKWKQDKAEDVVNLFQRQSERGYENLATKVDLAEVKGELKGIRGEIEGTKGQITIIKWVIGIGFSVLGMMGAANLALLIFLFRIKTGV